jgi:beta-phosphoglucomutase
MGLDDRGALQTLARRAKAELSSEQMMYYIARKAIAFARYVEAGRVAECPGAVEFVKRCAAEGPVGLCSGALRGDVEPLLRTLQLADSFSAMVTAEDVEHSKPNPVSYKRCIHLLTERFPQRGIIPGNTVAIEDTPDGIASARGAGLVVLGVTTNYDEGILRAAGARWVTHSLDGFVWPGA